MTIGNKKQLRTRSHTEGFSKSGHISLSSYVKNFIIAKLQPSNMVGSIVEGHKCDRIWENPPYGIFREDRDRNIYQKYY